MPRLKVMIVEDNLDLCKIYTAAFTKQNIEVAIKNDGLSAISEVSDVAPNFILLDIMLPELDGFAFLDALINNTGIDTKVIVASNLSSEADIKRALDLGAIGYLRKVDYTGAQIVDAALSMYRKAML
jgi:DNA-binding response OmpR family regulator